MALWKLQAWEPDTCEQPACRVLEWWDADGDPLTRVHILAGFERLCAAHADPDIPLDVIQDAWDGQWRDRKAFVAYQREFYLRRNHVAWQERGDGEAMPPQIARFTADPSSPGSVAEPALARRQALTRAHGRNRDHNQRKSLTGSAVKTERPNINADLISWRWEGRGDARVLYVHMGGQLNAQQRNRVQSLLDIQFGAGRVVIEG